VFFGVSGGLLVAALWVFRGVLLPFVLALIVAYVLAPLVTRMQRLPLGRVRMPRWVVVLVLYAAVLGLLSLFVALAVPRLVAEIERLARDAPGAVRTVRDEWLPAVEERLQSAMAPYEPEAGADRAASQAESAAGGAEGTAGAMDGGVAQGSGPAESIRIHPSEQGGYEVRLPPEGLVVAPDGEQYRVTTASGPPDREAGLTKSITEALGQVTENTEQHAVTVLEAAEAVGRAVVRGIFGFVLMLMLSAYLLITSDHILAFARSLVRPHRRGHFDQLMRRIDRGLSGVVRGQLLICVVNGVLSGIGFYLFDLEYWPVLTLVAAVLSIIPIFGAIISSIPAIVVALQQGIVTALLVLAWIVGIHQLEANLLNPKIMGDAAKVHPVLVIFALLAGEHVYGIAGALLAVPVLSVVQSLFLHFRDVSVGDPGSDPATSQT
jgi:predicted PurR-regulated permease PerM